MTFSESSSFGLGNVIVKKLTNIVRDTRGVAALEYALLVGFIVLVVAGALNTNGIADNVKTIFTNLSKSIGNASTASGSGS